MRFSFFALIDLVLNVQIEQVVMEELQWQKVQKRNVAREKF
jgi:hypothetical protein